MRKRVACHVRLSTWYKITLMSNNRHCKGEPLRSYSHGITRTKRDRGRFAWKCDCQGSYTHKTSRSGLSLMHLYQIITTVGLLPMKRASGSASSIAVPATMTCDYHGWHVNCHADDSDDAVEREDQIEHQDLKGGQSQGHLSRAKGRISSLCKKPYVRKSSHPVF